MRRRIAQVLLVSAFAIFVFGEQDPSLTGVINGTVVNEAGLAVRGAKVTVDSPEQGIQASRVRYVETDEMGLFTRSPRGMRLAFSFEFGCRHTPECIKTALNRMPDQGLIHHFVLMPVYVASRRYGRPVDFRVTILDLVWQAAGRFGDNFKGPSHRVDRFPVFAEAREFETGGERPRRFDVVQDVS